jgi:hypothetical protein
METKQTHVIIQNLDIEIYDVSWPGDLFKPRDFVSTTTHTLK